MVHPAEGGAADAAVPGWTPLINEMMKTMPRVAACLMNGLPALDDARGRLTVTFAADKTFQVSSISDDCDAIAGAASRLWGRQVTVELVLGDQGPSAAQREAIRREVAPTHREELKRACDQDPSLGELVDLLGGQPLPETDRENWRKPGD